MTISGSGYNLPNFTNTIYEQTKTQDHLKNAAELGKGSVLLSTQSTDISFTKLTERNLWDYNSDASRPSLKPTGTTRNADNEASDQQNWQAHYEQLFKSLPAKIQAGLLTKSLVEYKTLNQLLQTGAKVLAWQAFANQQIEITLSKANTENKKELSFNKELQQTAKDILTLQGASHVNYLTIQETLSSFTQLINEGQKYQTG